MAVDRFPLSDLLDAAERLLPGVTPSFIRHRVVRVNAETWRLWGSVGFDRVTLSVAAADESAIALGLHPAIVWPHLWCAVDEPLFEDDWSDFDDQPSRRVDRVCLEVVDVAEVVDVRAGAAVRQLSLAV